MALLPPFPVSQPLWAQIVFLWQFMPLLNLAQWFVSWYPQGKTSTESRWNLPGKLAWFAMEVPSVVIMVWVMGTLPPGEVGLGKGAGAGFRGLPAENWVMAGMFTLHYIYRAILSPLLLNPSMSPIHVAVWASATAWQVVNTTCIAGWLGGYGPTTRAEWAGHSIRITVGLIIWAVGLLGNIFHDDELREIRRAALRAQRKRAQELGEQGKGEKGVDKVYMIPQNGLFKVIFYPHFLCEWIEWGGFWMVGGLACVPARAFLFNEIATMLPRAVQGKRWYEERFGREEMAGRKAIFPGLL